MAFKKVGKASDIASGTAKAFEVGSRTICVCNIEGKFYAIDDLCSHAECNLNTGFIEGHDIECECHGSRFDVRTGAVTNGPAVVPVDAFKVRVTGGDIEVDA
jgi:nitrite reductase/ring-hydroxylating ferredoxin subunit